MALFIKTDDGYEINKSDIGEKYIIDTFAAIFKKRGFDFLDIICGVSPCVDFGYFELADRYWRASLCIYLSGGTRCFWESGIGYTEPWLFNARHSFELSFKGLLLSSYWLEEINDSNLKSGHVTRMQNLKTYFGKVHSLLDIYQNYESKISNIISNWNKDVLEENAPERDRLLLSDNANEILNELHESDDKSFRFRYPSVKQGTEEVIQENNWMRDTDKIYTKTGLPKESGYFFDHIKVVNSLHDLNLELTKIKRYCGGICDFADMRHEYVSEMTDSFY